MIKIIETPQYSSYKEVNQNNAVYVDDLEYNKLTFTAQELSRRQ